VAVKVPARLDGGHHRGHAGELLGVRERSGQQHDAGCTGRARRSRTDRPGHEDGVARGDRAWVDLEGGGGRGPCRGGRCEHADAGGEQQSGESPAERLGGQGPGVVGVPRPRPEAGGGRPAKVIGEDSSGAGGAPAGPCRRACSSPSPWRWTASITATVGTEGPRGIAAGCNPQMGVNRDAARAAGGAPSNRQERSTGGPTRPGHTDASRLRSWRRPQDWAMLHADRGQP
jgi:hypothetical protein